MKTPDSFWVDPSADELVLRHNIYRTTTQNCDSGSLKRRQLFSYNVQAEPLIGVPPQARDHVESLHQNAITTLLFGKNNVVLSLVSCRMLII